VLSEYCYLNSVLNSVIYISPVIKTPANRLFVFRDGFHLKD